MREGSKKGKKTKLFLLLCDETVSFSVQSRHTMVCVCVR